MVATADVNRDCITAWWTPTYAGPGTSSDCTASVSTVWSEKQKAWVGSISVPIADLIQRGLPSRFSLAVLRNFRHRSDLNSAFPEPYISNRVTIQIESQSSIENQQYLAASADLGNPIGVPPHRISVNGQAALSTTLFASLAFSEDTGQVFAPRTTAVSALPAPESNSYACHSCGTFQDENVQPFSQAITSASALGISLTSFGVDETPFSFQSATYPLDSAYKLVLLAPLRSGATTQAGFTRFDGTTTSSGYAHDAVFSAQETIPGEASDLLFSVMQADADQTQLPPAKSKGFASVPAPLLQSMNSQGTVAYAFSPAELHAITSRSATDAITDILTVPYLTYSTLVRYGAQNVAASQEFDIAESIQKSPPSLAPSSTALELWHFSGALGYRSVGANYDPIDGTFDAHAGENGPYASLEYTQPILKPLKSITTATYSLSAASFSRAGQVQDEAAYLKVSYPLSPVMSLQSNDTEGRISISQVGVNNGLLIPISQVAALLPNNQYNLQAAYGSGTTFQLTGGYTILDAQGCSTKLVTKGQPCYAYRQPTANGSVFWAPFTKRKALANLFIQGTLQGSTTTPFQTATDDVLRTKTFDYYDTNASQVVRSAAFGTYLLQSAVSCATLLLSSANRGGDINSFAKGAPVPGFTNSASMEYVPGQGWPSFFAAYSRIVNDSGSPPPSNLFVFRAELGIPGQNYAASTHGSCS